MAKGRDTITISVYQGPEFPVSVDQGLANLKQQAALASARGARLLIAPEMFLTGYNIAPELVSYRAQTADGPASQYIAGIASSEGIGVLYGYPERDGETIYNSAQLIDVDGTRLINYRKTHLFGDIDRNAFIAGDSGPVTIQIDGWSIGVLICYDVEFPENVRRLALAGADFVAVPTALMKPYDFVAASMLPTRAFENGLFIAYANHCGNEGDIEYCGLSCIVGPDGNDLARADKHEALIFAELNRDLQKKWRRLNSYLADRKPALYRALCDDKTKPDGN